MASIESRQHQLNKQWEESKVKRKQAGKKKGTMLAGGKDALLLLAGICM